MKPTATLVLAAAALLACLCRPTVAVWGLLPARLAFSRSDPSKSVRPKDTPPLGPATEFGPFYFNQRIDHFRWNYSTFPQRYWVNAQHYKPNGPVIFYNAGETDATERGNYVRNSSMADLAEALHGIIVVMEHRYYGESMPMPDLSTENLRFLTIEQALEDMAHFILTVKLPNLPHPLPPVPRTPWIVYGGSYSGNLAAWMRKRYPTLVFAAVASSAPVQLKYDFWEYFEPIRLYAPPRCSEAIVSVVGQVDETLKEGDERRKRELKGAFGLEGVVHDEDFANVIATVLSLWQEHVPGSNPFSFFCAEFESSNTPADDLAVYGAFVKRYIVDAFCPTDDVDSCFNTFEPQSLFYTNVPFEVRAWAHQSCTQFAYWPGAAPPSHPSLLSRTLTSAYYQRQCGLFFGPHHSIPALPHVDHVNHRYGGWEVQLTRVFWVDGEQDPWRILSVQGPKAPKRESTKEAPMVVIEGGVHHWEFYNGPAVPDVVKRAQSQIREALSRWLREHYTANRIDFEM